MINFMHDIHLRFLCIMHYMQCLALLFSKCGYCEIRHLLHYTLSLALVISSLLSLRSL